MGRPSLRSQRRTQLVEAYCRVLATHGVQGATITAVAEEAGIAPGLVHHHFSGKLDLASAALTRLQENYRVRRRSTRDAKSPLASYVAASVGRGPGLRIDDARAWVGLFAEAVRVPALFRQMRRWIDEEVREVMSRSDGRFDKADAMAVVSFVVGALVVGAFAPRTAPGFAQPALSKLVEALADR